MVNNLSDFIKEVNAVTISWGLSTNSTQHPWFRGQSDEGWKLIPSLYRYNGDPEFEREMTRDFKLNAISLMEYNAISEFDWLFIMQHHGLPTRLLDWTESYLVALFFAVENYDYRPNSAVWMINPWSLNERIIKQYSVPTVEHDVMKGYLLGGNPQIIERKPREFNPVALRPKKLFERIYSQKGMFTIHGKNPKPLEKIIESENFKPGKTINFHKIVIDGKSKIAIMRELNQAGISYSRIYPDLDGLSKEIKLRYSNDYLKP